MTVVRVFPDLEALSGAAAALVVEASRETPPGGRFAVALAGGGTPRRTYELLARSPLREAIDWERVHVFWGDERCVPPDDPRSNERMARRALLDHVPIPADQVHPLRCEGEDAERGARAYEALLRSFFGGAAPRFDLVLLGLGRDGHTASLRPGTAALQERARWVAPVPDRGEGFARVSLTLPVLDQARRVAFLVSGASKARVLREVLEEAAEEEGAAISDEARLPAGRVRPAAGEVQWLVDQAAASALQGAGSPSVEPAGESP